MIIRLEMDVNDNRKMARDDLWQRQKTGKNTFFLIAASIILRREGVKRGEKPRQNMVKVQKVIKPRKLLIFFLMCMLESRCELTAQVKF